MNKEEERRRMSTIGTNSARAAFVCHCYNEQNKPSCKIGKVNAAVHNVGTLCAQRQPRDLIGVIYLDLML